MGRTLEKLDAVLASLPQSPAVARLRADAAALRFHLGPRGRRPVVVLLGGTGTGKSTIVNRLFAAALSAADIRRTFTAGAVAVTRDDLPAGWLELPHVPADSLPARGRPDYLYVIRHEHPLTDAVTVVDTPDLDGDRPEHHVQADRAFRWADAVLFLVTPEKYQMTELLPYYRLATRYAVPAAFVMNKCQDPDALADYRALLARRDWPDARVFAVPRDDAAFEPRAEESLQALAETLRALTAPDPVPQGLANRATDLALRVHDQLVDPMRRERSATDRLAAALRALDTPPPGLDVSPVTRQLQQRLQERSILYLMGPQRIIERARQLPSLLARLPREIMTGVKSPNGSPAAVATKQEPPDFPALLADQFALLHTRIEDLIRSDPAAANWLDVSYESTKLPPAQAAAIATEELQSLKEWLENRWNSDPRDTKLAMRVLRHLPGGRTLTKWSEAAPYLLAVVVATHHAFLGPVDLVVLGGYSLVVWMTQRLSDEVSARSREANAAIARRFADLAHDQITRTIAWLDARVPGHTTIDKLRSLADELTEEVPA